MHTVSLSAEQLSSCNKTLKFIRNNNVNKLTVAHLNINSFRNKFALLKEKIKGNIDILLISETKIYGSIPYEQFLISSFSSPCRLDHDSNGVGIL